VEEPAESDPNVRGEPEKLPSAPGLLERSPKHRCSIHETPPFRCIRNDRLGRLLRAADAPAQRPNMLVIVADDLDTYELSCYGGRNLVTPNIDRLAAEGTRFTHMFSPQAMCVPTRAALYTGLHPFRNGSVRNQMRSNDGVQSIVHHLAALGYRVGIAGKVHVIPQKVYPFGYVEGCGRRHDRSREQWFFGGRKRPDHAHRPRRAELFSESRAPAAILCPAAEAPAPPADLKQARGVRPESQAQVRRHGP
jgi:arylsulfatase A-like enzyme